MNRYLSLILASILIALSFAACSPSSGGSGTASGSDSGDGDDSNKPVVMFDVEDDEVPVEKVEKDVSDFYGTWEATSGRAEGLYGNITITVKEGGTWEGNVTELDLGGTWTKHSNSLHMTDTKEGIFDFDLAFDKSGALVLIDPSDDDEIDIVLTKK